MREIELHRSKILILPAVQSAGFRLHFSYGDGRRAIGSCLFGCRTDNTWYRTDYCVFWTDSLSLGQIVFSTGQITSSIGQIRLVVTFSTTCEKATRKRFRRKRSSKYKKQSFTA